MAQRSTINSRLRVLVAKAFRAEKLYASGNSSRAERLSNPLSIAEASSEIRAKEWQRSHYHLRTSLNDILNIGNNSEVIKKIIELREQFHARSLDAVSQIEKGAAEISSAIKKQEFALIFKISSELIRFKAQAQACNVIADELAAVLDQQHLNTQKNVNRKQQNTNTIEPLDIINNAVGDLAAKEASKQQMASANSSSNVIDLSRALRRFSR